MPGTEDPFDMLKPMVSKQAATPEPEVNSVMHAEAGAGLMDALVAGTSPPSAGEAPRSTTDTISGLSEEAIVEKINAAVGASSLSLCLCPFLRTPYRDASPRC